MDVRMIGTGRPFMITIVDPCPLVDREPPASNREFAECFSDRLPPEIDCNYGVSAVGLAISPIPAKIEPKNVKCYRCVVYCSVDVTQDMLDRINPIKNLIIRQRTPSRVAHRREMMYREKTIIGFDSKLLSDRFFILNLRTSGGTYIKEFVNSDFGRTSPSLPELLSPAGTCMLECQLLQLDVVCVGE